MSCPRCNNTHLIESPCGVGMVPCPACVPYTPPVDVPPIAWPTLTTAETDEDGDEPDTDPYEESGEAGT